MPDTVENQELYPQPRGQKKGCGFPVMRLVVSFCLTTGILLSCRKGSLNIHERTLWHDMWHDYEEGDVVLADCGFCGFADYFLLGQKGVDCVMRLHQRRKEKEVIKKFNKNDRLIEWEKTKEPPKWITPEEWKEIPDRIIVRHVTVIVNEPGYRSKKYILATTLLEEEKYPQEALANLYLRRWKVELFIRDIKTTMRMDILRCKTPDMIHKELTLFIIAYNLIRILIWEAVLKKHIDPLRISVAGTIAIINTWAEYLALNKSKALRTAICKHILNLISDEVLPERNNRLREPRATKRRMKTFQLLTEPRNVFKEIEHRSKYKKTTSS